MNEYLAPTTLSDLVVIESYQDLVDFQPAAHSHAHSCNILSDSDSDTDTSY